MEQLHCHTAIYRWTELQTDPFGMLCFHKIMYIFIDLIKNKNNPIAACLVHIIQSAPFFLITVPPAEVFFLNAKATGYQKKMQEEKAESVGRKGEGGRVRERCRR